MGLLRCLATMGKQLGLVVLVVRLVQLVQMVP